MGAHLRAAVEADVAAMARLDRACFPAGIAYSRAEFDAALRASGSFHLLAEEPGPPPRLRAFILTRRAGRHGHIITIDVAAEARRQGEAQRLMAAAEAHYRARGAAGLRLEVAVNNAAALRFYLLQHFEVVRRLPRYYAANLDALLLLKTFAPS